MSTKQENDSPASSLKGTNKTKHAASAAPSSRPKSTFSSSSVKRQALQALELAKFKRETKLKLAEKEANLAVEKKMVTADLEVKRAELELKYCDSESEADIECHDFECEEHAENPTEAWVKSLPEPQDPIPLNVSDNAVVTTSIECMITKMGLPPIRPPDFNGNPIEFRRFIDTFTQMTCSRSLSDNERLWHLQNCCTGEAKAAIHNCLGLHDGYQRALNILKKRFGHPYDVVTAFVNKITEGNPFKPQDAKGILGYAGALQDCVDTLGTTDYQSDINASVTLRRVVNRLPQYMQNKWMGKALKLRDSALSPKLSDIAEFVMREAECLNDPVFGKGEQRYGSHCTAKPSYAVVNAVMPDARPQQQRRQMRVCPACRGEHKLFRCEKFTNMNYEQKQGIVQSHRLCFNCLGSGHSSKTCKSDVNCKICDKRHHTMLHRTGERSPAISSPALPIPAAVQTGVSEGTTPQVNTDTNEESNIAMATASKGGRALVQTVAIRVKGNSGNEILTYALLDTGSSVTLCTKWLAGELGLDGPAKRLTLATVSNKSASTDSKIVNLRVTPMDNTSDFELDIPEVWVLDDLNIKLSGMPKSQDTGRFPHLKGIPLAHADRDRVDVIIGTNVPEALIHHDVRMGKPQQPIAVKTCLGWCLIGPSDIPSCYATYHTVENDVELNALVERFWTIENNGVSCERAYSIEDKKAIQTLTETTNLVAGHYQTGLLWRNKAVILPNNREQAIQRLGSLRRKFSKSAEFHAAYKSVIQEYVLAGHAKKLTESELAENSDKTFYLPHHAVSNPNKNKLRVVFDAAAKFKGVSLNGELLQGPDLTNDLVGVLLRFRENPIAIVADVAKMFHQIQVRQEDTQALRFLWWSHDIDADPEDYAMQVHIFGATDSPCCATYALQRTADDNHENFSKQTVRTVKRNFYVDDLLKSVSDETEAIQLAQELTDLLSKGGFQLTKWASNSATVLRSIEEKELANEAAALLKGDDVVMRALGVKWNVKSDKLGVNLKRNADANTKRSILSSISSNYDPLGIAAPILLPAKLILQQLWTLGVSWDDKIPEEQQKKWQKWIATTEEAEKIVTITRTMKSQSAQNVQLHHFSDASDDACGTVTYLRSVDATGQISNSFVIGKTRLAPIKHMTTPRLELQAATMAVRIDKMLQRELDIEIHQTFFWTDSTTVLKYIQNESRRFHSFVATRVEEIRQTTEVGQWKYVNTKHNPADIASRGATVKDINENTMWLNGPEFLHRPEHCWPDAISVSPELQQDKEVKKAQTANAIQEEDSIDRFFERYSSWRTLVRKTAWLQKFFAYLKNRNTCEPGFPTPNELKAAESAIIGKLQKDQFKREMTSIEKEKQVRHDSPLRKLKPIIVNGILRIGGRLFNAPISFEARHPAIVPKHHVSQLILRHYHIRLAHPGYEHVLSELRQTYWLLGARTAAKGLGRKCFECRKTNATRQQQVMSDLPSSRLNADTPPFTNTGLDYFGPLLVKVGRKTEKRWGCIFTCLTSRAVHLEVSESLDTNDFLDTLRRFINRRGKPTEIWSDNGSNFTSGQRELKQALDELNQSQIQSYLHQEQIQWHFQPPTASHMSGVWERIIRSVRKALIAVIGTLGESHLPAKRLYTFLTEVEAILNSRPITPSSDDPRDQEALTPNHLLLQRHSPSLPPGIFDRKDNYVRRRWRQTQYLANLFWDRWKKEYIPLLQTRQKWTQTQRNMKINDLVLIVDDTQPRGSWQLGRIVETYPGHDGRVRVVKVHTKDSELKRPISKLCLLEEAD